MTHVKRSLVVDADAVGGLVGAQLVVAVVAIPADGLVRLSSDHACTPHWTPQRHATVTPCDIHPTQKKKTKKKAGRGEGVYDSLCKPGCMAVDALDSGLDLLVVLLPDGLECLSLLDETFRKILKAPHMCHACTTRCHQVAVAAGLIW